MVGLTVQFHFVAFGIQVPRPFDIQDVRHSGIVPIIVTAFVGA